MKLEESQKAVMQTLLFFFHVSKVIEKHNKKQRGTNNLMDFRKVVLILYRIMHVENLFYKKNQIFKV